jgi:hypothetical protein
LKNVRLSSLTGAAVALGALFVAAGPAQAILVTNASAFPISDHFIDFNQFSGSFVSTSGPVEVGSPGNSVSLTANGQAVLGAANFGLGLNGSWNSSKTGFVGLDAQNGSITFTFNDGPVSSIGSFLNYSNNVVSQGALIEALASDGSVIEAYDLRTNAPISTPDAINQGAFRGIARSTADIAAFRISNAYVVADDLRFSRSNVSASAAPEPGTLALAAFGVLPLGIVLRRRRQQVA